MKKIIIVLFAALFCTMTYAQDNAVTTYFSDYQQNEDFTKVSVTSKMFSLFTEIDTDDPDEKEILEAMSKLKGIKGLVNHKSKDKAKAKTMYLDAVKKVSKSGAYEELMSVEDNTENVMFMVRESGGKISELLMIAMGGDDFIIMTLYGEIDLSQVARLSKVLKIKGMEHFGDMHQDQK